MKKNNGANDTKTAKEKMIDNEYKKLSKLFDGVDERKKTIIDPLLHNSAFMCVTLKELEKTIMDEGTAEEYHNGANQFGRKISADLQAYNNLLKNYQLIQTKLLKLVPDRDNGESIADVMKRMLEEE